MKDHHRDKAHPHHKGGGMPAFNAEHHEHKMSDVSLSDGRYGSEMNQAAEYKASVDGLSHYAKTHKQKH